MIKDKSFNVDGLDKDKYGFTPGGNFHVKDGRTITVDLRGHTIDNTACPNLPTFGFESNTNFIITNGTIKGGENALRADGRTKVHIKADTLTVTDTAWAGIYMGVHSIGAYNAKDMTLEMNNCTIKNAKQESAIRVMPRDSKIILTNCTFENNQSTYDGGAIYTETLNEPFIKDCTFKNNKANNGFGGAIRTFHIDNNNVIKNCQFTNNSGRGANVFVQYAHGMGEKLTKDWGNTINSTSGNGMGIVYK